MKIPWLKKFEEEEPSLFDSSEKELLKEVYNATEKEIKYVVSDPCEDEDGLCDKISIIEENLTIILRRLKLSEDVKQRFTQEYPKWKVTRTENIESLEAIGTSLHSLRKNCNISRLVGNCTSLIGGGICIASAALAPFTLGLSSPLAIAGGTITMMGSAASVGTTVTEMAKLRSKIQEANNILEKDQQSFEVLKLWLVHASDLSEALERIYAIDTNDTIEGILRILRDFVGLIFSTKSKAERSEMVKMLVKSTVRKIPRELIHSTLTSNLVGLLLIIALLYNRNNSTFQNVSKTLNVMSNIVSLVDFSVDVLQSTSAFIKSDIAIAAGVSKSVTKTAVAAFGMSLDMASIVLTSIDVHKGSLSTEGKNIMETAAKLKQELNILDKVYSELNRVN